MSYLQPQDSSRRFAGIGVVIVVHAIVLYALVNGLARKIVDVVQAPLETRILTEVKPPPVEKTPPPPSPPPPKRVVTLPPPYIPPPEVRVELPPPAQNTITAVTTVKPALEAPVPPPPAPPPVVAKVAPVVDARDCARPDYPPVALRFQEQGLVVLQFLIDIDGRAIDSRIEKSSGFKRLDEAARRALALCKFKPGTEDGKPAQSWARIEYQWKIEG